MLNSELAQTSVLFPKGFARDFDAHIYFDSSSRLQAKALREQALIDFEGHPVFVGHLIDALVGPHSKPMFEFNFPKSFLQTALFWLMKNRNGLSVLVHQVTGDDPKDHSAGAIWLGEQLRLDESKLDPSPVL